MDQLGNLIPKSLKRIGVAKRITASIIVEYANQILRDVCGDMVSDMCATSIRNGILTIVCKKAIIAQELTFYEKKIIFQLNEKLKENTVKKIHTTLWSWQSKK